MSLTSIRILNNYLFPSQRLKISLLSRWKIIFIFNRLISVSALQYLLNFNDLHVRTWGVFSLIEIYLLSNYVIMDSLWKCFLELNKNLLISENLFAYLISDKNRKDFGLFFVIIQRRKKHKEVDFLVTYWQKNCRILRFVFFLFW